MTTVTNEQHEESTWSKYVAKITGEITWAGDQTGEAKSPNEDPPPPNRLGKGVLAKQQGCRSALRDEVN